MGSKLGVRGAGALVVGIVGVGLALPSTSFAHAVIVDPPARDKGQAGDDAHKNADGACGGVARTGKYVQYQAGATIEVKWDETIEHVGCFQIAFSPEADPQADTDFQLLKQINDPDGSKGPHSEMVTLPEGVTCEKCTLQLRQLMQNQPGCVENADPAKADLDTYHSCADICIGPSCPTIAPDPDGGASSSSSSGGGPTTEPTDGGGKMGSSSGSNDNAGPPSLDAGKGDGCSVGWAPTGFGAFGVGAALFGLALVRRRRRAAR